MKIYVLLISICINLAGCVGMSIHDGVKISYSKKFTKENIAFSPSPKQWDGMAHPVDGTITIWGEKVWCGNTLWVLIPLPIWPSLCAGRTEVTYANNEPIKVEYFQPSFTLYACGPFMPLSDLSRSPGLCAAVHRD